MSISVTKGKHLLVPKEVAEAAEKHAKVCIPSQVNHNHNTIVLRLYDVFLQVIGCVSARFMACCCDLYGVMPRVVCCDAASCMACCCELYGVLLRVVWNVTEN